MKPILKYLKDLFAKQRVLGGDPELLGLAKADALLMGLVNDEKIPGLAITVLKKGQALLQKGYGLANLENSVPVDPKKTLFRTASVAKPIAATALAHMVAEGTIELDSSFYAYVPYYPKKKYDFTIRQLAGHTAGIRGYRGVEYGLNKPYSIKEGIEIFKDDDLLFEPGTDYLYNSYDWVLVSLAMQEASGIPFEDYVQSKVLLPLGMDSTFPEPVSSSAVENPTKINPSPEVPISAEMTDGSMASTPPLLRLRRTSELRVSQFYSKNRLGFRKAIPVNNFYKLAGGGYLSTVEDIAQLGQAYLEGRILKEELLAPFLSSETINGTPTYYGLGWQVSEDQSGRPYFGHIGNGVGGYSNFFVYPREQMVISILVNCTDPKVQGELDEIVSLLLESNRSI